MYNNYINDRDILVDLESKVLLWLSWDYTVSSMRVIMYVTKN